MFGGTNTRTCWCAAWFVPDRACGPAGHQTFKAGDFEGALSLFEKHVKIAELIGDKQLQARAENKVSNAAYWITQRWGNRPNMSVTKALSLSGVTSVEGTTHMATRICSKSRRDTARAGTT
jgi:hypothetical protein